MEISQPFHLGVYEVTQGEYEKVMGSNPSFFAKVSRQDTRRFPVERVSWYEAIEFCNKLSEQDGLTAYYTLGNVRRESSSIKSATVSIAGGNGYRLPTEAEWEYACRGGTTTPFHFGGALNGDRANIHGNLPYGTTTKGKYLGRTTTVGSFANTKNEFGLFDMHGNVYEWCFDVYNESEYEARGGTTKDPVVATGSEYRVLRGGSWNNDAVYARSAARPSCSPVYRLDKAGFRVVR